MRTSDFSGNGAVQRCEVARVVCTRAALLVAVTCSGVVQPGGSGVSRVWHGLNEAALMAVRVLRRRVLAVPNSSRALLRHRAVPQYCSALEPYKTVARDVFPIALRLPLHCLLRHGISFVGVRRNLPLFLKETPRQACKSWFSAQVHRTLVPGKWMCAGCANCRCGFLAHARK